MRVLVIEDEPGIAQFVCQGLTEAGYAVDMALDGEQGLSYAHSVEYDLIVLDILLPRLYQIRVNYPLYLEVGCVSLTRRAPPGVQHC